MLGGGEAVRRPPTKKSERRLLVGEWGWRTRESETQRCPVIKWQACRRVYMQENKQSFAALALSLVAPGGAQAWRYELADAIQVIEIVFPVFFYLLDRSLAPYHLLSTYLLLHGTHCLYSPRVSARVCVCARLSVSLPVSVVSVSVYSCQQVWNYKPFLDVV